MSDTADTDHQRRRPSSREILFRYVLPAVSLLSASQPGAGFRSSWPDWLAANKEVLDSITEVVKEDPCRQYFAWHSPAWTRCQTILSELLLSLLLVYAPREPSKSRLWAILRRALSSTIAQETMDIKYALWEIFFANEVRLSYTRTPRGESSARHADNRRMF